jgi:hypothetical protein
MLYKAITIAALAAVCVSAQAPPVAAVTDPNSELTPQQQREKQIRMFDPLDKSSPLLDDGKDKAQGQEAGAGAPVSQRPVSRSFDAPLPGSIAASNQAQPTNPRRRGPEVLSPDDESPVQEYTGPAVLSRSYTIARPVTPEQVKWSPHLGFASSYSSVQGGTDPASSDGAPVIGSGFGYTASWGITGRHFWKHDQIGLDYSGSRSKIGGYSLGAGTNHTLNLDYEHQVSRRLSFNLVSSGAIFSQNYGLQDTGLGPGVSIANINIGASPTVQLLDIGTRQFSNQASLTWRKSARLSFSASGGVFFVQRSDGLYGNTGYQSQADVNYRQTKRMTVGAYYSFTDYMFSHRVSLANLQTVGGIYSYALGRSTQIRLRAGVTRIESENLQTVPIDPAIAVLLGQSSTVINAYSRSATSDISAQLVRDFHHNRTASISYVRGVAPGNGQLLTSTQEGISASFGMRLFRRYNVSGSADRFMLSSVDPTGGKYGSTAFVVSVSRPINHHMNADFGFTYRTFDITSSPLLQRQIFVTSGISWNPGENWLKSW